MNSQEVNAKNILNPYIHKKLKEDGKCVIRGLGTFNAVEHKGYINNFGKTIKTRKLVRFTATRELKEILNK